MADGDVHTSKQGDKWINKVEGNQRASNSAATKAEAQQLGRDMAKQRGVEHFIHNQDGRIGERNTYPGAEIRASPKAKGHGRKTRSGGDESKRPWRVAAKACCRKVDSASARKGVAACGPDVQRADGGQCQRTYRSHGAATCRRGPLPHREQCEVELRPRLPNVRADLRRRDRSSSVCVASESHRADADVDGC